MSGLLDWKLETEGLAVPLQVYASADLGRGYGVYDGRRCPKCGAVWVAVAAVGTMGIECPVCYECNLTYVWKALIDEE